MKYKNNVFESYLTPMKDPGKIIQKPANKSSFHIIAIAWGIQVDVRVGREKKSDEGKCRQHL